MASITQLEYLVAVDRCRHFGKAAQACHVSQPTLSMQLQKLEDELGLALFDRSKQPIVPTPEGIELIEQAKAVIREFSALNHMAKSRGKEPAGELRLAVIPTLAPYLLPLFVGTFARKYPKVTLIVEELTTEGILRALEEDKLDAGLLATPLNASGIVERPVFYEPFHLFVHKDHPLFARDKIREEDLDGSEIWLLAEGHCLRSQVVRVCQLRGKSRIFPNVRFESGNLETIINLVAQGHGYTLLPHLAARQLHDASWRRMVRQFTRPVPSREVSLVFRRTQYKQALLGILADQIAACVPDDLPREKSKVIEVVAI